MSKKKASPSSTSKSSNDISLKRIRLAGISLMKGQVKPHGSNKCMRNPPRSTELTTASSFDASQAFPDRHGYNPRIDAARLSLDATQRQKEHQSASLVHYETDGGHTKQNIESRYLKRIYHQQFHDVVAASDVLLQVLDARDPLSSRLTNFEKMIYTKFGRKKTIFLVLNKVDLIPDEIALVWQNFFSSQGMLSIPFSTTKLARYTASAKGGKRLDSDIAANCTEVVFREIRKVSKTESGVHRNITVGVVGLPNVGKSSVINALKRRDVMAVSAHAGSTKSTSMIDLKKAVKILDCPGIITRENLGDWNKSLNNFIIVNAIKVSDVPDPLSAFEYIVRKVGCESIRDYYGLEELQNESLSDLIDRIGRSRGILLPGGFVDRESTARNFLYNWSTGKIKFYTLPSDGEEEKTYHVGKISPIL